MEELLSIPKAAALLQVSVASVRRWSDAGLIPVQRIGRRRERRFREADLRAFIQGGQQPARQGAGTGGGIAVGGRIVPLRTHLAPLYATDEGRFRIAVPFLADGLKSGQTCLLVAGKDMVQGYLAALAQQGGSEFGQALLDRLVVVGPAPGNTAKAALRFWEQTFWEALARGPAAFRVVGEMASVGTLLGSPDELIAFEGGLDLLVRRFPAVFLCQFDVREFDGPTLLQVMKAHPDVISYGLTNFLS